MALCLHTAWRDLSRRLAVLAGAGSGLLSLVVDAPVQTAALHGLGAYVALTVVARIGGAAILSTSERARVTEAARTEPGEAGR